MKGLYCTDMWITSFYFIGTYFYFYFILPESFSKAKYGKSIAMGYMEKSRATLLSIELSSILLKSSLLYLFHL